MNQPIQPTQGDIARQAQRLWLERGCPEGHHEEIWLEAEDQLTNSPFGKEKENPPVSPERLKSETAAESLAEFHISPPVPQQEAIKAALQKKPEVRTRQPRKSSARTTSTEPPREQPR
jgi:hypothetical protein